MTFELSGPQYWLAIKNGPSYRAQMNGKALWLLLNHDKSNVNITLSKNNKKYFLPSR